MWKYFLATVLLLQFVSLSADDTNAVATSSPGTGTDDNDTSTLGDDNTTDTDIDNTDDTDIDGTDDTNDETDTVDDADTDGNDDEDELDDADDTEFETTEDSTDLDTTSGTEDSIDDTESGSIEDTASGDSGEDDGDDSTDDNDDDSTDDDDDTEDEDGSVDADTDDDEEEDVCEGLVESDCDDLTDDDGDLECAFNKVSGDCYAIERREGRFGSGNFDDGFIAAQQEAEKENAGLYAVIGVLGGVVGIMLIVIALGGYYLYSKGNKGHAQISDVEMGNGKTCNLAEDDNAHLMENTTHETR